MRMAVCFAERWSLVFGQECLLYLRCERPFRWPTSFHFSSLVSSREWLFLVGATEWAGEGGREHSWGLYNARRPAAAGCMVRWAQASGFPDGRGRGRCSFAPSSVRAAPRVAVGLSFRSRGREVGAAWSCAGSLDAEHQVVGLGELDGGECVPAPGADPVPGGVKDEHGQVREPVAMDRE